MSEESARVHAAVEERGGNYEEAWNRIKNRNEDLDWDIERMLPEIFGDEEDQEIVKEGSRK